MLYTEQLVVCRLLRKAAHTATLCNALQRTATRFSTFDDAVGIHPGEKKSQLYNRCI